MVDGSNKEIRERKPSQERHESRRDFVAIVSLPGNMPVHRREIEEFSATYLRVRTAESVAYAPLEGRVCAATFATGSDDGDAVLHTGPEGWCVATGSLIGAASLLEEVRLASADGHFGLVLFEARSDAAVVATDPMGMQSVFVAERDGRAYVSTSALVVARHLSLKADRHRILSFLRAGYHFGEATHWQSLRRLNPGTALEVGPDTKDETIYWRPARDGWVDDLTLEATADHSADVMCSTIREYLGSRRCTWADLSGGYDSRLLSLALENAGVFFKSCTRGDPDDDEVSVARRVAHLRGWDWTLFSYPDDWHEEVKPLFEASLESSDGHRSVLHIAQRFWKHARTSAICPSLVGGGAGELFRHFFWQQEFHQIGRSNRVNFTNLIDMRLLHPMRSAIFTTDPTPGVRADYEERLRRWVEPYGDELNTTQLDVIYAYKSTGTYGIEGSAERRFHIRDWPFLYRPLVVSALSANFRYRRGHRLVRRMMERLDPQAASVRTSPWGGPAQPMRFSNSYRFVPYYFDVGRRASMKIAEKLSGGVVTRRPDIDERMHRLRISFLDWAGETLGRELEPTTMRCAPLLNVHVARELLARARSGDPGDLDVVDRLVTLELALSAADSTLEE
jgi:hypothetical protein